ncbi:hypothetical protein BLI708_06395 [Bifidobacterium imperatoris]|uniref:Uncharacterized protein n=1 Tax=Bifidobacterium imperatoris TaxID=2020965 RepID=A0A2N5IQL2_9BIFI|nr:hypothetical protein [Bifidobacterium imperatoris]PLS24252.1 hypothetical protein Tam1G_1661 [Bifidobacterium imperatoris]QSY56907.1 hypothetical protein BLI708_06395 [Bifidobacterium imperatoris]
MKYIGLADNPIRFRKITDEPFDLPIDENLPMEIIREDISDKAEQIAAIALKALGLPLLSRNEMPTKKDKDIADAITGNNVSGNRHQNQWASVEVPHLKMSA